MRWARGEKSGTILSLRGPLGFPLFGGPVTIAPRPPLPTLHTDSPAASKHTKTTANPCVKVTKKAHTGAGTVLKRLITAAWTHLEYKRPLVHDQGARTSSASPARHSPSSPERPSAWLISGPSVNPSVRRSFVKERRESDKSRKLHKLEEQKMEGVLSSFLPPSSHLSSRLASRVSL